MIDHNNAPRGLPHTSQGCWREIQRDRSADDGDALLSDNQLTDRVVYDASRTNDGRDSTRTSMGPDYDGCEPGRSRSHGDNDLLFEGRAVDRTVRPCRAHMISL